jgi:hypothetical protein
MKKSASLDTGSLVRPTNITTDTTTGNTSKLFDILQSTSNQYSPIKYLYTLAMHVSHYLLNFSVHAFDSSSCLFLNSDMSFFHLFDYFSPVRSHGCGA